ncbi:MAG: threonine--tRNA ligase [Candidatus Margulisbacteria bacterium]|nr:threonine--tRNA ligase [Candidatus Margulisiibacteriota bacterium]
MYDPLFPLSTIRHSAAHVLAQAVLRLFPDAKLGIGPAIDEGFYYDLELPRTLIPIDLLKLEKYMRQIIQEKQVFKQYDMTRKDSEKRFSDLNQTYKLEIIQDLNLNEYSFFENGPFIDLCRGPHVEHTGQIGAIKLLRVSGAYWRGSEKNKMLQRIYGTAFHTQEELEIYIKQQEEALKRDHRVLGKALDLFSIQDDIGGGLILWHPKGARIRNIIETYWKDQHFAADYDLLYTPHVGKANLWETSGHLQFYKENMFAPMVIDEQDYFVRPMNCPFHILVYQNAQRSYRDLPIRYAELGTVYRFERSGALHGLMRVRGFTQDDGHIICTPDQVQEEILSVLKLALNILKKFGFEKFKVFLSTRPEEKFVGHLDQWKMAEDSLRAAIETVGLLYEVDNGGGAFYGPKIDIKIEDAIGREWQCSTVQFDFNLPERFDMTYIDTDGQKKKPVMIHRALFGSVERFFGVLIEHYEGKFPMWLASVQFKLLTVSKEVQPYAKEVLDRCKACGFRAVLDDSSEKIGYKIRQATQEKVPFMLVIGHAEKDSGQISVRSLKDGDLGQVPLESWLESQILGLNK